MNSFLIERYGGSFLYRDNTLIVLEHEGHNRNEMDLNVLYDLSSDDIVVKLSKDKLTISKPDSSVSRKVIKRNDLSTKIGKTFDKDIWEFFIKNVLISTDNYQPDFFHKIMFCEDNFMIYVTQGGAAYYLHKDDKGEVISEKIMDYNHKAFTDMRDFARNRLKLFHKIIKPKIEDFLRNRPSENIAFKILPPLYDRVDGLVYYNIFSVNGEWYMNEYRNVPEGRDKKSVLVYDIVHPVDLTDDTHKYSNHLSAYQKYSRMVHGGEIRVYDVSTVDKLAKFILSKPDNIKIRDPRNILIDDDYSIDGESIDYIFNDYFNENENFRRLSLDIANRSTKLEISDLTMKMYDIGRRSVPSIEQDRGKYKVTYRIIRDEFEYEEAVNDGL